MMDKDATGADCPHDLSEQETACADGMCPLCSATALAASRREVERLSAELADARFSPMGDNHHNAAVCPYCRPTLTAQDNAMREKCAEVERLSAELDRSRSLYDTTLNNELAWMRMHTQAEAEVGRLREALRQHTIDVGLGYRCMRCHSDWMNGGPEHHKPGCLAALSAQGQEK